MGMLRDAGYAVFAPTLPYHEPGTEWTPSQGQLQAQDYVDYIVNVRAALLFWHASGRRSSGMHAMATNGDWQQAERS